MGWGRGQAAGYWLAVVCLGLALSGCGGVRPRWYQAGKGQVDFDRDAQECALIAHDFARQATATGKAEDPAAYAQANLGCLTAKGWSMSPPPAPGAKTGPQTIIAGPPLTVVDGGQVRAFGAKVGVPEGFSLASNHTVATGPTVSQSLVFKDAADTFLVVMAQRTISDANRFEPTPYLVKSPFFLYQEAPVPDAGPRWAIFCGQVNGGWVEGLGSYPLTTAHERLTIIVTRPLPAPRSDPQPGFKLSAGQFAALEAFKKQWGGWLSGQVALPSPSFLTRLEQLGLFRP